ncbi:MAG TPA: acyltransferase [Solirubrobacteraceae bacterium]|nr:acyltransferase [Solirubrobacteraceae bacterium]
MRLKEALRLRFAHAVVPYLSPIRSPRPVRWRSRLEAWRMAGCGPGLVVKAGAMIDAPERLTVGARFNLGENAFVSAVGGIAIGDDVLVGHAASLLTADHGMDAATAMADQPLYIRPIVIEDDVWIGSGARVLAGVTIRRGAVIAANAVVVEDVEAGQVVGGVPARPISSRRAASA